jgi:hypothetical protein
VTQPRVAVGLGNGGRPADYKSAIQQISIMPLIKLSRINKGGEIVINSDHILFIEIESKVTTVHMTGNLLFSVEEPLDSIAITIEAVETARIKNAIQQSGLTGK